MIPAYRKGALDSECKTVPFQCVSIKFHQQSSKYEPALCAWQVVIDADMAQDFIYVSLNVCKILAHFSWKWLIGGWMVHQKNWERLAWQFAGEPNVLQVKILISRTALIFLVPTHLWARTLVGYCKTYMTYICNTTDQCISVCIENFTLAQICW